jgi:hypothetical protein
MKMNMARVESRFYVASLIFAVVVVILLKL